MLKKQLTQEELTRQLTLSMKENSFAHQLASLTEIEDDKFQGHIVYKCPTCKCLGAGNRMVDHMKVCNGRLTRKLREAERDGKYAGREAEAIKNTEILMKAEALKELKVSYREMKQAIKNDIIVMKGINKSVIAEAYQEYYTNMF